MALPNDPQARKSIPLATGFVDYFPSAIVAVAALSAKGNDQHNPGSPLHWDRAKSGDEADALFRHFMQRGTTDNDGVLHSTKVAWRALAMLQKELEESGAPLAPGAKPFPMDASVLFDADPKLAAQLELGDEDSPLKHLKHMEAFHGTSSDRPIHALGEDAE